MARIYVASSWKNDLQPMVVQKLRLHNHEVYDFRNPWDVKPFKWQYKTIGLGPDGNVLDPEIYKAVMLTDSQVASNYLSDYRAMQWADVGILVQPCGRSAHLELGYMAGRGKRTIILLRSGEPPDLMQLMADHLCISIGEILELLK